MNEDDLKDLDLTFQEQADPQVIAALTKIGNALALIYKKLPQINLPSSYAIKGDVSLTNTPTVKIENLQDMERYFQSLETRIMQMGSLNKPSKIEFPPDRTEDIIYALQGIQEGIATLYNRPQMTPQPVTNVNINALNGSFLATDVTVTGTATALPPTTLAQRRSLILFNNSSQTVYVGGLTVAASGVGKGFPILSNSYSPSFDAGANMKLYGIVNTGTAEVQILEISNDNIGR